MGVKSTYDISRQTAINVILSKLYNLSNDALANMLEEFEESEYRNYSVHDQLPEDARSEWTIKDAREF